MALTFDTAVSDAVNGSTSNTWSHSCTGSNRVLFVFVGQRGTDTVSGVTYAGDAMTSLGAVSNADSLVGVSLWRLIAPDTGANDVIVSWPGAKNAVCVSMSFAGAHQTDPDGTPVTGSDTSGGGFTNPSLVVTSAVGEIVADMAVLQDDDNTSTLTVVTNTQRTNDSDLGANAVRCATSTAPGAASVTMSWTPDTADDWAGIAVAVLPAADDPARPSRLMTLGAA